MKEFKSSYYNEGKIIGLYYHSWLEDELAWYKFINDVNHEVTHWFLHCFIDLEASVGYDEIFEIIMNPHIYIGYKNQSKLLIVNALFHLKHRALLVVKRVNMEHGVHYEVHYDKKVEFVRVDGDIVVKFGVSEVESV